MPDPELMERVRTLRERGSSPKEIARALRLPPATVAPLIRAVAAERPPAARAPVIAGCWVSAGWAAGLSVNDHPEWPVMAATGDLGREGLVTVPVDLARHLVFGAVAYARELGFEPHPDFAAAAGHLEPWSGPSAISFGRDGKPFFMPGPYDDAASVMKTLKRSVGRGNFDFTLVA